MNEIPPQVLLAPVIAIAVVVYMLVMRGRAAKQHDTQWSQYRASELATRLGLQLVKGDPGFNFFIRQANADVARGPADGKPILVEVLLEEGDCSLRYLYRVEQETDLAQVRWRTWFDCRMTVRTQQPFPPFEVTSRNAPMGPIVRTQRLPELKPGDATYLITTNEAGVGDVLREHLPAFSVFVNSGVHLVGDGQSVSFVMKHDKAPLLANALYYAEDMQRLLTGLARSLGG